MRSKCGVGDRVLDPEETQGDFSGHVYLPLIANIVCCGLYGCCDLGDFMPELVAGYLNHTG